VLLLAAAGATVYFLAERGSAPGGSARHRSHAPDPVVAAAQTGDINVYLAASVRHAAQDRDRAQPGGRELLKILFREGQW